MLTEHLKNLTDINSQGKEMPRDERNLPVYPQGEKGNERFVFQQVKGFCEVKVEPVNAKIS